MALRELAIAMGLKVDAKDLEAADKRLTELLAKAKQANAEASRGGTASGEGSKPADEKTANILEKAKHAAEAFIVATGLEKLKEFVVGIAEQADALHSLSERYGVSTDEIQKWQYAVKMSGGSVEGAAEQIGHLQKTMGLAVTGNEEAAKAFGALGVKVKDTEGKVRPVTDVAADVADKVAGLGSEAEQAARLIGVFGKQGAELVPLMKGGSKAIREAAEEFDKLGLGLDSEVIEKGVKTAASLDKMGFAAKALGGRIAVELFPTLAKWADSRTKSISDLVKLSRETNIFHTSLLAMGAVGATAAVGGIVAFRKEIVAAIKDLGLFKKLQAGADFFGGGKTGWLKMALTAGVAAAAILGLYLVFDDLYNLLNGDKSVIGGVWEEMNGAGSAKQLADSLRAAWVNLTDAFKQMKPVAGEAFAGMLTALPTIVDLVVKLVKLVLASVQGLIALGTVAVGTFELATAGTDAKARRRAENKITGALDTASQSTFGVQRKLKNEQTGEVTNAGVGGLYGLTPEQTQEALGRKGLREGEFGPPVAQEGARTNWVEVQQNNQGSIINIYAKDSPEDTGKAVRDSIDEDRQQKLNDAAAALQAGIAKSQGNPGLRSRK